MTLINQNLTANQAALMAARHSPGTLFNGTLDQVSEAGDTPEYIARKRILRRLPTLPTDLPDVKGDDPAVTDPFAVYNPEAYPIGSSFELFNHTDSGRYELKFDVDLSVRLWKRTSA